MAENSKVAFLDGVETQFIGDENDAYFQGLQDHAGNFDVLAALVRRQVPRNGYVLDIGANIGLSAILSSRLVGRVVAYEPSPPNLAFLRRNLLINKISNVEVVAAAASDKPGTIPFHVSPFGAGSHVVAAGHVRSDIGTVEVSALPSK